MADAAVSKTAPERGEGSNPSVLIARAAFDGAARPCSNGRARPAQSQPLTI